MLKAAQSHGYEHTQFFIDDGYSGTGFERPALKQMEEAIQAGIGSAVIVKDVSRLGRDYLKIGHYIEHFFPLHNVRFIAVSGGIDSNTNSTDFLPLYSVMDEWYARDISRKLKIMYHTRATKGEPIGIPVYGYAKSQEDSKYWEPGPKAALVVQRIYHLALTGYGVEQIAGLLEKEKILTPAHYRLSQNKECGGRKGLNPYKWASSSVAQILSRQEYCGDIINLKTYSNSLRDNKRRHNSSDKQIVLKNVHEPIIERSIWEYVQQKRQHNKRTRKARKQSLFSGFLRCGGCESNLHYHFNQNNPSIEYYNCANYTGNRGTCPNTHYVRLDYLEVQILNEINLLIINAHSDWDSFAQTIQYQKLAQAETAQETLSAEYRSLANCQGQLATIVAKLYEDKITGEIDDEIYSLLSNTFKAERSDNRQKCQQLQESIRFNQSAVDGVAHFLDTLATYSIIEKLTREVLHEFVDFISVYPAIRNGKKYTQKLEIHYLYVGQIGIGK